MTADEPPAPPPPPAETPALPSAPAASLPESPHVPAELAPAPAPPQESHPSPPAGSVVLPVAVVPSFRRHFLGLAILIPLAIVLIAAGFSVYHRAAAVTRQRTLVTLIIVGLAATLCLAGAMRLIDAIVNSPARPRWFWRWPLYTLQRLALIAQLAATGAALFAGGLLFFHADIPGTTTAAAPSAGDVRTPTRTRSPFTISPNAP